MGSTCLRRLLLHLSKRADEISGSGKLYQTTVVLKVTLAWNRAILSEYQSKKQFIKKWWGKPHAQEQGELFHIFGSRRLEKPSPDVILKCSANTLNKRGVSAQNENLYNPLKKAKP